MPWKKVSNIIDVQGKYFLLLKGYVCELKGTVSVSRNKSKQEYNSNLYSPVARGEYLEIRYN